MRKKSSRHSGNSAEGFSSQAWIPEKYGRKTTRPARIAMLRAEVKRTAQMGMGMETKNRLASQF
jgi:hypothetical protein